MYANQIICPSASPPNELHPPLPRPLVSSSPTEFIFGPRANCTSRSPPSRPASANYLTKRNRCPCMPYASGAGNACIVRGHCGPGQSTPRHRIGHGPGENKNIVVEKIEKRRANEARIPTRRLPIVIRRPTANKNRPFPSYFLTPLFLWPL